MADNVQIVLSAFEALFNKRDYAAAERFWSPNYIHIAPTRSIPPTLGRQGSSSPGGDFVIVHGRFPGFGAPVSWIAADIVRLQDGILVERWDVIQDEATQEQSKGGLPMFGDRFPQ
jgi:predicted SnoaL-like aldol condensation-catalyzing enzyme